MAKKVLIIEDDTALAENLSNTIKAGGMEVFVCHDGEAGFRQAEDKKPDLILLDLVLQKNPELKSIPVIVLTNLESPHDIEKASSFGIKAYLVKANYTLAEILKKIKEVLEG